MCVHSTVCDCFCHCCWYTAVILCVHIFGLLTFSTGIKICYNQHQMRIYFTRIILKITMHNITALNLKNARRGSEWHIYMHTNVPRYMYVGFMWLLEVVWRLASCVLRLAIYHFRLMECDPSRCQWLVLGWLCTLLF